MVSWLKSLDRILRGEATRPDAIKNGNIDFQCFGLTVVVILLAMIYGFCMGSFSLFKELGADISQSDRYWQLFASTVKVPGLFLLTLIVTFPSLYVFNALVGSRLNLLAMLKLLIASLAVNLAVLASLGPITAFFSVSTASYLFIQVFNVAMFTIAGTLGLLFLNQTLNRMSASPEAEPSDSGLGEIEDDAATPAIDRIDDHESSEAGDDHSGGPMDILVAEVPSVETVGAIDRTDEHMLSGHVRMVFRIWVIAFCLVGAQMGWVLRPFIGNPDAAFTWFRERESNFFQAILRIIGELLIG